MITIKMIEYWNDYHKKERRERFADLDALADWIFGQMQVNYSDKDGSFALWFPKCDDIRWLSYIKVIPEYNGPSLWIKQIEDDSRRILFSDGTFTAGQKHCTRNVREWLAKCENRKNNPTFRFASDRPEAGEADGCASSPDGAVMNRIKKAAWRIHEAGGCDATDEYSNGYDDAIAAAVNIILDEFGMTFEEIEDYLDSQEQGL